MADGSDPQETDTNNDEATTEGDSTVEDGTIEAPGSPEDDDTTADDAGGTEGENGKKKKEKRAKKEKVVKDDKMGRVKDEDLDWIWIGNAEDARDAPTLKEHNIRYILNCTPVRANGGVANFHEKDPYFSYCRVAMGDNATETLATRYEPSWAFLETARIREDGGVLIHCQQGVSRSVSMAMAYMMKYYRKSYDEALALSKDARAQACPNTGFAEQLKSLDEELRRKNGYEPLPPKRLKTSRPSVGVSRGPVGVAGPSRGPAVGPARGPVGPSVGPVGPSVGPARGPVRPAGPPGASAGPAPASKKGPIGPPVGPPSPPATSEKRKASGPAKPPVAGPTVPVGPSKPKKAKA